ncbi:hypothetical protein [Dyadobacter sp. LHD-138]|uniref:hypothetical protein n=1 Tax=Dyadobacter sp. LHD-138 TaxID=3071413 RepID=UPI0027DFACF8|nr:hypothetical protein [Dyadobacter sp. LHD-138]MDQ6480525.1 hypothetical protein [Dyadobacter sp. LHD-138]
MDTRSLLENYKSGYSLPQAFYTDEEVFDMDIKHVWRKYWLFAGIAADIPKPGDYYL